MKDYISMKTDCRNKIALSIRQEMEKDEEFSDASNASGRFLRLAEAASNRGILGLQISADEIGTFSSVAFTSKEVKATTEDFSWVFKKIAVSQIFKGYFLEDLYEGNRIVYALTNRPDLTSRCEMYEDNLFGCCDDEFKYSPNGCFEELIEMLAEADAVIRIIIDSPKESDGYGPILISIPDNLSLRLRGMFSIALPDVGLEIVSNSADLTDGEKYLPGDLFQRIMSNLLYALIRRKKKQAKSDNQCRGNENTASLEAEYDNGLIPSEKSDSLTLSIEALDLSPRTYNCLKRAKICTIDDLKKMGNEDLRQVHNLGIKSISEINKKLAEYSMEHPDFEKIPMLRAASYYDMLDELIGLKEAKQQIRKIAAFARMRQDITASGGKKMSVVLNMEFIGNPGTAKTTVARIIAGIFHEIGLLSNKEMIEVGRADLIGKYEGQTAGKVKDVFSKAKGKMLFIDEAYSLVENWEGAYGDEAINTIVQEMENSREDTIVVFAGYPDKMKDFFDRNPGLRSRVPFTVRFDDYSTDEMAEIVELEAEKRGFRIAEEAMEKVREICNLAAENIKAGNGRLCRNLVEGAVLEYALRNYDKKEDPSHKDFILRAADFRMPSNLKVPVNKTPIGFMVGGDTGQM